MITVKNLKKSFGDNEVLKGIDYEIKQGEKIVIIGPSGSGKSTFLRCLNLLETPTDGEIYFDGQLITDKKCDINKVREHMGMVFQHFNLFNNKTILENITLAPVQLKIMTKEQANAKALELLERVGLADKANAYPSQISGGQKQRAAIVRSLAMNPKVMLFDEPTSALDLKTERVIAKTIENIRNKIVIIVSHSNVFGNIVDNIYEVKKNDIIIKEGREYGD